MGLVASPEGLKLAHQARKRKKFNIQSQSLCNDAHVSLATLRRFWESKHPINVDFFLDICSVLGFTLLL